MVDGEREEELTRVGKRDDLERVRAAESDSPIPVLRCILSHLRCRSVITLLGTCYPRKTAPFTCSVECAARWLSRITLLSDHLLAGERFIYHASGLHEVRSGTRFCEDYSLLWHMRYGHMSYS